MAVATPTRASEPSAAEQIRAADLERFELLRHLGPEQLQELIRRGRVAELAAGEPLMTAGQLNHRLYLVLEGRVQLFLHSVDGDPTLTVHGGETIGEDSILDQRAILGHVIAAERCRVLVVSEESFWNLLGSSHTFALNLLLKLSERLRSSSEAMTRSAALRDRFERAALFDPLTNVNNRRWLETALPRIAERHAMESQALALAIVEIDGFDAMVQRFGPDFGDRLLTACAILLRGRLRPTDQIARYRRASFAVILPSTELDDAEQVAERMRSLLQGLKPCGAVPAELPLITVSVGIAGLDPAQTAAALQSRAEAALHRAQQLGPGQVAA
jgi:diguanylate cyclase (GGDEF)-like protein